MCIVIGLSIANYSAGTKLELAVDVKCHIELCYNPLLLETLYNNYYDVSCNKSTMTSISMYVAICEEYDIMVQKRLPFIATLCYNTH